MSTSRFATPLMLSLAASGTLGLVTSQQVEAFGISELPQGYGLIDDTQKAPKKQEATPEDKAKHEGKCGEGKCGEGKCGSDHAEHKHEHHDHEHHANEDKTDAEGKCGEGKCGEGKCGGAA
ncbi:hypothetical protein OS187_03545 [Xanthomonadaceae bacterium JHOS43]|nr:hypothetical protein [Xanthomonadaceae bacterium JHOS43]MCX7563229.1 hypothetical protein [Xanthomonadaceae bacterium XH05]